MLPTLTKNKILGMSESASAKLNDPTNYPYGFSVSVGPILPAAGLIEYVQKQGYKKAAIIGGNDAFGTSGGQALTDAARSAGLASVSALFPAAAVDVTPQLDQLKSQSPDVLLYTANGTQLTALMKGRAKLGWSIPTIGDLGSGSGDIWQGAGGEPAAGTLAMVYPVQPYIPPAQRPKPLVDLFTELQKIGVPPFTSGLTILKA
jgi:branched-chain amino acid transport system substrate-binding protein